ncbi:hypothetical protein [Brevundimonas sp.]|uniref:hypothetical protein n=1 Tax=Brevundimonas sp. TaxID=1871086 RepID=UPI0019A5BB37|nr:hypothetical protein [Brevundimonas sp.]MBD3835341.1 hypothetical protein [Brevundimonas sp.]
MTGRKGAGRSMRRRGSAIDGGLRAMADLGLIDWSSDGLAILREPTPAEMDAARKDAADPL